MQRKDALVGSERVLILLSLYIYTHIHISGKVRACSHPPLSTHAYIHIYTHFHRQQLNILYPKKYLINFYNFYCILRCTHLNTSDIYMYIYYIYRFTYIYISIGIYHIYIQTYARTSTPLTAICRRLVAQQCAVNAGWPPRQIEPQPHAPPVPHSSPPLLRHTFCSPQPHPSLEILCRGVSGRWGWWA